MPAMTRAGSPGIMRTPVKTIMLITKRVTTEIAARWTRKSNTAATSGSVPGRAFQPDQAVGDGLVALEALRERDDAVQVIDVDDVAQGGEEVDGLPVEAPEVAFVG